MIGRRKKDKKGLVTAHGDARITGVSSVAIVLGLGSTILVGNRLVCVETDGNAAVITTRDLRRCDSVRLALAINVAKVLGNVDAKVEEVAFVGDEDIITGLITPVERSGVGRGCSVGSCSLVLFALCGHGIHHGM